MRWFLLSLLFFALEITLLVLVGVRVGIWPTLGLLALGVAAGIVFARSEGLRVWTRYKEATLQGRMPEEGILSGLLVLAGGLLLILPGFLSDLAGVVLLLPPARRRIAARVRTWLSSRIGPLNAVSVMPSPASGVRADWFEPAAPDGDVIDTEGVTVESERLLPAPPSRDPEEK